MSALEIDDEAARAAALRQSAEAFVATLASRGDETETLRHLPAETVADLKSMGFSRLCQPRRYGGAELPLDAAVDIISILARGCASTAWVTAIHLDHSILSSMFPAEATDDIWGDDPQALISAGYFPAGKVERLDGGWRLAGKWGWVSGCDFADWFLFGAFLPGDDGALDHNFFLVPRSDIEIEDNWHVMGLCGTGSKNVAVRETVVPDHRVLSLAKVNGGAEARGNAETRPLYRLGHVASVPFAMSAVALGIAESLLEIMTAQIAGREAMGQRLAALQSMQLSISEAAAEIDCARLLMARDTAEAMAAMRDGRPMTILERARNRRDMTYMARLCKSATNRLSDMAGASGVFDGHPAQRKFRDLQTAVRHIALSWEIAATTCGEVMFGLEPNSPLF